MSVMTSGETLESFLWKRFQEMHSDIENLDNIAVTRGSLDALMDNLRGVYGVERLVLEAEGITRLPTQALKVGMQDPSGGIVRSRQLIATFRIPYTGLQELWDKVPEGDLIVATSNPLGAFKVGGPDHLLMQFKVTAMEPWEEANARKQMLGWLEAKLGWTNRQVDDFNEQMPVKARQSLEHRLRLIEQGRALDEASDIPIYRAPSDEQVPIPLERKRLRLDTEALAQQAGGTTDLAMAQEIYEDVVQTIERMTRAMERTPTAARLGEEEIRDLILFVLNANYQGAVAGEVFNGNGKTDILLRWNDENAFIGECKFWKGPAGFRDAIDQLLGYVTWRDTKAALIVFVRTGQTSDIMTKARRELSNHVTCVSESPDATDTRSNFVLHSTSDSDRLISVALVIVPLPQAAPKTAK